MKRFLMVIGLFAVVSLIHAQTSGNKDIMPIINEMVGEEPDCDTIVVYDGYHVHIIKNNGMLIHAGLNLFNDDVKESFGRDILNRLETELLKICLGKDGEDTSVQVVSGNSMNFKNISPETSCSITESDSRNLSVEWDTERRPVKVTMPLNYQIIKGGSRAEIEEAFISNVKKCEKRRSEVTFDLETAEPYGDDKYIIPGSSYLDKDITRNAFLTTDSVINPVWDSEYPLESMANMFICPNDHYGDIELNITVLKHEYGEQEKFLVRLENFLAYCEEEGCIPFWGVERFKDGKLEGALFLYNQGRGYDHVLKIDCNPQEVIEGNSAITARASLFVPTNNVDNLFQPYIKKNDKEKIRYDHE